jgi:hypothetical protein
VASSGGNSAGETADRLAVRLVISEWLRCSFDDLLVVVEWLLCRHDEFLVDTEWLLCRLDDLLVVTERLPWRRGKLHGTTSTD